MPIIGGFNQKDGNIKEWFWGEEVADDGQISLPASSTGFCLSSCGDEFAIFFWSSSGSVVILLSTANVSTTDTDGNFCLLDGGTCVNLKNRLGDTKDIIYLCIYE